MLDETPCSQKKVCKKWKMGRSVQGRTSGVSMQMEIFYNMMKCSLRMFGKYPHFPEHPHLGKEIVGKVPNCDAGRHKICSPAERTKIAAIWCLAIETVEVPTKKPWPLMYLDMFERPHCFCDTLSQTVFGLQPPVACFVAAKFIIAVP